eukprot:2780109-Rhodomonas_salina.1
MSSMLLLNTSSSTRPQISQAQADKALAAFSEQVAALDIYFLDSACSFTISGNASVMIDLHDIPPRSIEGLTGARILSQAGTLCICVPDTF